MAKVFRSSGDLIADRRYQYACELAKAGDDAAAADLFEQALERAPDWAPAWVALGRARERTFDIAGAATAYREAMRRDPADEHGASLYLARIDAAATVDAAPHAYVEKLFDAYAGDFDRALVERLGYVAPQLLAEALGRVKPRESGRSFARALDLGCGTGLMGERLAADVGFLEGVDISGQMLDAAKAKGFYDALSRCDLQSALLEAQKQYDLIVAADVLIYFGDLARVVGAAARRLEPSGLLAFTLEACAGEDWRIGPSLRFAHSEPYIRRTLAAAGLELVELTPAILRKDAGADVDGFVIIARRTAAMDAAESFNSENSPPAILRESQ